MLKVPQNNLLITLEDKENVIEYKTSNNTIPSQIKQFPETSYKTPPQSRKSLTISQSNGSPSPSKKYLRKLANQSSDVVDLEETLANIQLKDDLTLDKEDVNSSNTQSWQSQCVEVIKDSLYFYAGKSSPSFLSGDDSSSIQFVCWKHYNLIEPTWRHTKHYFGPISIPHILRWRSLFEQNDSQPTGKQPTCVWVDFDDQNIPEQYQAYIERWNARSNIKSEMLTNAIVILASSLILFHGKTATDAFLPFQRKVEKLEQFGGTDGDRQSVSVLQVLQGLEKGIQLGLLKQYEIQDNIELNISWIVDNKLAASVSPKSETLSDFVDYCHERNISGIVRLNDMLYDKHTVIMQGIKHLDIPFYDGSIPSSDLIRTFFQFVDNQRGAVLIHCHGGIGRTGTLLACQLMRLYKFTAVEAIGFIRLRRPGSINSLQHRFLALIQEDLWEMGETPRSPRFDLLPAPSLIAIISSRFREALNSLSIPFDLDDIETPLRFTFKEFNQFFHIVRQNNIPPWGSQLQYRFPAASTRITVSDGRLLISLESLLYLIENLICGGRVDITDDFEEERSDGRAYFH